MMRSPSLRRGASAVEFALAFPFIVLLLTASTDFALWSFSRQAVSRSVQDGAREASRLTLPADANDGKPITDLAEATTRAALDTWGLDGTNSFIIAQWAPDVNDRMWLTVTARVPYTSIFGIQSPLDGPVTKRFTLYTQEQTQPERDD
ncbi:MAG: TadE family protein [Myxococcota bacterium]